MEIKAMPPLVSFIVVNWNGAVYLEECLNSILQQTESCYEIIVVDNASTDSSRAILNAYTQIQTIWNDSNRGFGPANNQALNQAKGDFVAFINNDSVLDRQWLSLILKAFENPKVGMCAGKTLSYDRPNVIDNTGHLLYWDGVNRGRGRMQTDYGQFDSVRQALLPSGCASVFRTEMLRQIGQFDEDFYLYGDDTEIGLRARLAGWDCSFVPTAIAYHRYSASTSRYDAMKFYFVERNRFWVAIKYFPFELLVLNPIFSAARWTFHLLALASNSGVSGEFARDKNPLQLFRLWWKAQSAAWKCAPKFWRKRRDIQRQFRWTRRRFYECFLPNRIGLREITFTP
jgi:GT2 family glycosyltransferase